MFGEIEGTGFEVIRPEFSNRLIGHARVERLWAGARCSEGPAWFAAGRYLVWSDIPNNRVLSFNETDGSVPVFRAPSNYSNGNTLDRQGRPVTCEHLARRVTRTEHDGSVTVVADSFEGKRGHFRAIRKPKAGRAIARGPRMRSACKLGNAGQNALPRAAKR